MPTSLLSASFPCYWNYRSILSWALWVVGRGRAQHPACSSSAVGFAPHFTPDVWHQNDFSFPFIKHSGCWEPSVRQTSQDSPKFYCSGSTEDWTPDYFSALVLHFSSMSLGAQLQGILQFSPRFPLAASRTPSSACSTPPLRAREQGCSRNSSLFSFPNPTEFSLAPHQAMQACSSPIASSKLTKCMG